MHSFIHFCNKEARNLSALHSPSPSLAPPHLILRLRAAAAAARRRREKKRRKGESSRKVVFSSSRIWIYFFSSHLFPSFLYCTPPPLPTDLSGKCFLERMRGRRRVGWVSESSGREEERRRQHQVAQVEEEIGAAEEENVSSRLPSLGRLLSPDGNSCSNEAICLGDGAVRFQAKLIFTTDYVYHPSR